MQSEKANAGNIGSTKYLTDELTMTKDTPNQNKFQFNSRRDLLEQSKLARLPQRNSFQIPTLEMPSVCINCSGRLDADDSIQQSVKVCRKCLLQYATIDQAINEASKRKTQAMLEKMAEVKQ